jgi:hypothetical protein
MAGCDALLARVKKMGREADREYQMTRKTSRPSHSVLAVRVSPTIIRTTGGCGSGVKQECTLVSALPLCPSSGADLVWEFFSLFSRDHARLMTRPSS